MAGASGQTSQDVGAGAGSGALTGAAMGTMIAPGPGTLIGAGVGAAAGALGGMAAAKSRKAQAAALKAQQDAIDNEMQRRAQGVGAAQQQFGDVSTLTAPTGRFDPATYQNIGTTLQQHANIAGGIEGEAAATRDAAGSQLVDAAQHGAASMRAGIASRGLAGSSLGDSAKQQLLAQYAGQRGNVAAAAEGARQGGWQGVQQQENQFVNMARGGSDISGQLAATKQAGQIAGARGQIPYATFGNLINTGIGMVGMGATSEASGGQGLQALGLPPLGVTQRNAAGSRASGATTSRGY